MMPNHYSTGLSDRSIVAVLALRLSLLAALFGLFLPFFGPILDHHFAERQHNHAHIYLMPRALDHVHFYDDGHSHAQAGEESKVSSRNLPSHSSGTGEIIYVTTNEGAGQSLAHLAGTTPYVDVVYPVSGDDHFLPGFFSQDICPAEAFVPPPERPPQT